MQLVTRGTCTRTLKTNSYVMLKNFTIYTLKVCEREIVCGAKEMK